MQRQYSLDIKFSKNLVDWGKLQPDSKRDGHYLIRIDSTAPIVHQVGTLLHEFCHMIFYMFLAPEAIDVKREHRFCKKIDDAGQRGFKRYLDGK